MLGHNNPPLNADDYQIKAKDFQSVVEGWTAKEVTDENVGLLQDQIVSGKSIIKEAEDARTLLKKPHLEAGREIDASFKPIKAALDKSIASLNTMRTTYLKEKERRLEEERRKAQAQAEAEAREAEALVNDPILGEEAREKIEAAQNVTPMEKARVESINSKASSLRSYYRAEVTDPTALVSHYASRIELIEAATKIANAEARTSKGQAQIPGARIIEERKAV